MLRGHSAKCFELACNQDVIVMMSLAKYFQLAYRTLGKVCFLLAYDQDVIGMMSLAKYFDLAHKTLGKVLPTCL